MIEGMIAILISVVVVGIVLAIQDGDLWNG
jgi:hypothetical protein